MFRKRREIIVISWLAVILWMGLIFNLSAQPRNQSNGLSKGITEVIVETVEKVAPKIEFNVDRFNHIIRKNAHFFVYLILGVLVLNALRRSGVSRYKSIALSICVLYAISDEVHQMFVPGRGPQVKDVFIDSAGASVGIFVYSMVSRVKKKVISNS